MLRKITALFLLTFASMIMLAFAVIPHHHHQEYICFNAEHCTDQLPGSTHSHDTEPIQAKHGCVENLFQTQLNRDQFLVHSCTDGHCHHFTFLIHVLPDALALLTPASGILHKPFTFYQEKLHLSCPVSSLAGRAPPFAG